MLTVEEVRQRYGVTEATVLQWIASGQLSAINVGRAPGALRPRWRISVAALAAFEAARTASPPVERAPRRRNRQAGVIEFIR